MSRAWMFVVWHVFRVFALVWARDGRCVWFMTNTREGKSTHLCSEYSRCRVCTQETEKFKWHQCDVAADYYTTPEGLKGPVSHDPGL